MNTVESVSYLDGARAALGHVPATKATYATEGVLEAVWEVGGRLVISGGGVRAVRVPRELGEWVAGHQKEVLRALHRNRLAPVVPLRRPRSNPRSLPRRGRR